MASAASFSVKRPVLIHLVVILLVIGGAVSYRQMAHEQFPDIDSDRAIITTVMPGASPKEIEQLITTPMEEELAKIDDIDEMQSTSSDSTSTILIFFLPGVDLFEKITEIQNQIEKVERFPEEAENPIVVEARPNFPAIAVSVVGSSPEPEVKAFVDDFEDELKSLAGVDEIRIAGVREREIWVEVDPLRLQGYGLSLNDVATALGKRNLNLPGGLIRMDRGEFSVRTEAEFQNVEQIRETILLGDRDQGYVFVRDVAEVSDRWEEQNSLARLNGAPAATLTVTKGEGVNALDLVKQIKAKIAEFEPRLPAGSRMHITDDISIEIRSRLSGLYSNMFVGLLLVIGSFTLFIGWRPALMVAAGIPVAFLTTFILLHAWGSTVNMLVLFSLILVLGLMVDDAIVVCENVYRHVEKGMPLRQAAIHGTEQITWPVLATVMTTVAAFLPLLLMTGILGEFMKTVPIVVTLALLASLVEAFFILPCHISEWGGRQGRVAARREKAARPWLKSMEQAYRRLLGFFLRHRYLTVAATLLGAFLTLNLAYSRMEFVLMGGQDLEAFAVAIEAPTGASLKETERIVKEVESQALALSEETSDIENVRSEAGSMGRADFERQVGSHFGEVSVDLSLLHNRQQSGHEVKDLLRSRLQDVAGARTMSFEETRTGPPVGLPVAVNIKGDNFATLKTISEEIKDFLASIDGVKDIIDNFPLGKDEVRPELDLEKLAALGLDVQTVASEIRGAFEGIEATRIYDGNEEVEVMVKFNDAHRRTVSGLQEMNFATPNGLVPFSNIGRMVRLPGYSQITHHDQKRTIQVTADVVEGVANSRRVNEAVFAEFSDLGERYPGYNLDLAGEFADTQESIASMIRAFSITLILIYVILGGLFQSFLQPLIVMFAVPLAFMGVIIGFFITGHSLGLFSIIGTIALAGIVVNDSLILIDFINRERTRGRGRDRSVLLAGAARLRPIILTSVTTILGLLPMSIGLFGVDRFLQPMAMAIAWGLTFATALTLIVVPCVYRIFDDISMLVMKRPLAANLTLGHDAEEEDPAGRSWSTEAA